jgi:type VI protein secretion system component Hcp
MAAGDSSDLVMMFLPHKGGHPVPAESRTNLLADGRPGSGLLTGFKPGHIFEIDKFTFKAGTSDDSSNGGADKGKDKADKKKSASTSVKGGYQAWRAGKAHKYPVDLQPVSFTRSIDSASLILLQNCIDCESYHSATLVKRRAVGSEAASEPFLRFDFVGVLVVSMDWSNDDEVEETCQFICRSVTISYRPQLPDGSLGAIVPGFWSMVPGEQAVTLSL